MRRLPKPVGMLLLLAAPLASQQMALDYLYRYNCQPGTPDHLMGVAALSGDRALVAGNQGLALVDLAALPAQGTSSYLFRLTGINARDLYLRPDEQYVFVNSHRSGGANHFGFDVVRINGNALQKVTSVAEDGVLYEKMCLAGDRLYVAAHAHGIRIYDVSSPQAPVLVGQLADGFDDAFDIEVTGTTAYVADGGGGLKIVDVSDETAPQLTAGETLATAVGTYEELSIRDGRVWVAAGGAGLAAYQLGSLSSRTFHPVPSCAESLCWVGEWLAVGSLAATTVFEVGPGTAASPVASENAHRRGPNASLRFAEGVGAASGDRLMVAGWNFMDVYEILPAASSTQPDINCDAQRIRFAPAGGAREVTLSNDGAGALTVSSVSSTSSYFSAGWSGGTLAPGQSVSFDVTYSGSGPSGGSGRILIQSNDPDEGTLPIQVFGNTTYLDPGEPAVDFTLQTLERDPQTGLVVHGSPFTLSQHSGKVVWFSVFGTW